MHASRVYTLGFAMLDPLLTRLLVGDEVAGQLLRVQLSRLNVCGRVAA